MRLNGYQRDRRGVWCREVVTLEKRGGKPMARTVLRRDDRGRLMERQRPG
jgi:hypothetical protein